MDSIIVLPKTLTVSVMDNIVGPCGPILSEIKKSLTPYVGFSQLSSNSLINSLTNLPGTVLKLFFGGSVIEFKLMGIISLLRGLIVLEIFISVRQNIIFSVFPLSIYSLRNLNLVGQPALVETKESFLSKGLPHMYLVINNLHVFRYFTVNSVPFFFRRMNTILNTLLINLASQLGKT
jgi:hypothetical protein